MVAGRDWLVGESLSIADLGVIGQLNALLYAQEAKDAIESKLNIRAWMTRIDEVAPKWARSSPATRRMRKLTFDTNLLDPSLFTTWAGHHMSFSICGVLMISPF